jgi:hypothetical protein
LGDALGDAAGDALISIMFTASPCTLVMAEESSYTQLIL